MMPTLPITPELVTLCRTLAADVAADNLVYSDDEYQSAEQESPERQ